jgi:hypothetical protein
MAIGELQITEIIDSVVSNIDVSDISGIDNVYFDFGNYIEISNKLSKETVSDQKYPLFALILDVRESEINDIQIYKAYSFTLIIAYYTEKDYASQQRRDNIFKPILQPLYRKFINEILLNRNGYFNINQRFIDHSKYDRYFIGSQNPNQNRFNDFIDAIEIQINNLEVRKNIICN